MVLAASSSARSGGSSPQTTPVGEEHSSRSSGLVSGLAALGRAAQPGSPCRILIVLELPFCH